MNCKKCDQTVFDLSIRSLKDIPNGPKCDQKEPSPMIQVLSIKRDNYGKSNWHDQWGTALPLV